MNRGTKAAALLALAALGALFACAGSSTGSGGSSTGSGGSGTGSGGSGRASSSSSASSGTGGSEGCGGGCIDPGQCYDSSACQANEYCQRDNCYPIGNCTPMPDGCPAVAVCGCNGEVYNDACAAAADGQSPHLSFTECSEPPAGQFACGTGYCSLNREYCRQGMDGALSCAPIPAQCAGQTGCSCLLGATTCLACQSAKGGGELLTSCQS